MRRLFALILAFSLIFTLAACSAEKTENSISLYDLRNTMSSADKTETEMLCVSSSDDNPEELLARVLDIDYDKVEGFFIKYASSGAESPEETVVVLLRNERDCSEAVTGLRAHVDKRISMYSTYAPKLVPMLDDAEIFAEGRFAVLIVSDCTKEIKAAFNSAVNS